LGLEEGTFRRAGLDVRPRTPSDPSAPLKLLQAGRADLAISYEPELLLARDNGAQLVAVGALVQKPLTSIISLPKAKIREPADLKGKTVGTAGIDYQSAYLQTILDEANVPRDSVKERNVGFSLTPALLTGKVDAVLGAFWNYEGVELKLKGKRPRIIRMEDAGVPTYNELVLVANADALERDGDKIRAFIGALSRGVRDLREDPDGAIEGLLAANRPDLHVVAAGRGDTLRTMYSHWTGAVRRSKNGILLRPNIDLDGDLVGVNLPRRAPVAMIVGRGYLAQNGEVQLVQVAMSGGGGA
ncbi:MAG: ABC transporter substrate-binding protein, partial [Solirubrobacteraceae bacterium]